MTEFGVVKMLPSPGSGYLSCRCDWAPHKSKEEFPFTFPTVDLPEGLSLRNHQICSCVILFIVQELGWIVL